MVKKNSSFLKLLLPLCLRFTFLLLTLGIFQLAFAQVTLEASAVRTDANRGVITVKATIDKDLKIFTAKATPENEVYVSTLSPIGTNLVTIKIDSVIESGTANSIELPEGVKATFYTETITYTIPVQLDSAGVLLAKGKLEWLGLEGVDNFPNGSVEFAVNIPAMSTGGTTENPAEEEEKPAQGWTLFLLTLLVGFGAVFTPCVFPLIPVTVSFFLKKSKTRAEGVRSAWTYTLSIILIYTIPTLIFTLIFGDKFLYQLSTHPISNLIFFAIFLIFAISFFGAFEISLPSSWANKSDSAAQRGGLLGIFFMALTLVIVSFSCTGPIIGAMLGETSNTGISMGPVIGMLGFAVGLAIPFGILALFPSLLQSLPKSGGWLNTVKVFFGFIELALALKFFSNADLVYHWGILTRPVFLASWIVIFTLLGFYLIGKLKFSHDSDLPYISVPRIFMAMASFTFALYMVPGIWGAPLKPLSGLLPPPSTQDFDLDKLQYMNVGGGQASTTVAGVQPPKKYIDKFHVPFGLTAYYDLDEAKAASKILKKPLMLDFTGWSCANCRKMENEVWSKPEILQKLRNDFVLVSLYVDDRTDLPLEEQYTTAEGDKIKTIGDKNLELERSLFNFVAQPLYKFMDHEGEVFSKIQMGYTDLATFSAHLDAMKAAYANKWP